MGSWAASLTIVYFKMSLSLSSSSPSHPGLLDSQCFCHIFPAALPHCQCNIIYTAILQQPPLITDLEWQSSVMFSSTSPKNSCIPLSFDSSLLTLDLSSLFFWLILTYSWFVISLLWLIFAYSWFIILLPFLLIALHHDSSLLTQGFTQYYINPGTYLVFPKLDLLDIQASPFTSNPQNHLSGDVP